MTEINFKTCPVCYGKKSWTTTKLDGLRSVKVEVTCTACEGKGKIPFVDLTKAAIDKTKVTSITGLPDGWRISSGWSKTHYFKNGKSLCGGVTSESTILRSKKVDGNDSTNLCVICEKRLD